eukprot:CAMPEP_0115252118 /NCGR_PEP_ID=MMETSP0270-20121206/43982_1 /TAXON_ID=71861 /ORGANISM="Scrippsiella trochoidea, Strain CCMP3099" /LENGTH=233 /DNA_ID=CAMNT_0002667563 /DNA_START=94 /DNA_END=792 /DNA_ORIENTATION=+
MTRLLALISLFVFAEVQQVWGSLKTPSTRRLSAKAFFESSDLHEAVADTLTALSNGSSGFAHRGAVHAYVAEGFKNATHGAQELPSELTWQQKVELLRLVRSVGNLSLHGFSRRLLDLNSSESVVYHYRSSDGDGTNGTGALGSDGSGSVSKVMLSQVPGGLSFTVGPAVGGMYLISGKMDVTRHDEDHMSGSIKAGFVNLHSTLSGTWRAEGADLNSTLYIHLTEMGFDEEW